MPTSSQSEKEGDPALDAMVRSALEAPPHVASRVVTRALRADTRGRRRAPGVPRRAVAAAVGLLLVAAVVVGLMWPRTHPSLPAARAAITNEGDIMIIKAPDRPITLIAPGAMTSSVPPGTMSIVLLGESK